MLNSFFTALLHELLGFASKHPDFFSEKTEEREEKLKNLKVPVPFKHYLQNVSEDHFVKDLHLTLDLLSGAQMVQLPLKGSLFFKAVLEFFTGTFASKLDELSNSYYLLPYEKRIEEAKRIIESDSLVARALRDLLVDNSYQEIASTLEQLSNLVVGGAMVLVQTPRDAGTLLKKEMRGTLSKEYPLSFPKFQVNRELIGGFRVFVNGTTKDFSWFARILKITTLKPKQSIG
ncbi:MAG: hypothetical protein WC897_04820 [Candidatus Gracilibacteria bacterium]